VRPGDPSAQRQHGIGIDRQNPIEAAQAQTWLMTPVSENPLVPGTFNYNAAENWNPPMVPGAQTGAGTGANATASPTVIVSSSAPPL
jgi:hypothetical protein